MITTELLTKKTSVRRREFVVGIHREGKNLLVRKSELIGGIKVALDETYVLNIDDAVLVQQNWINELHAFTLN